MYAEFKNTLVRLRGGLIGWSIGLALYGLLMSWFYSRVTGMDQLIEMVQNYPEEMKAFFSGLTEINTPRGYIDTYYFSYMSMIIGIFFIGACARLLAGDEENGILDLVMSYPVSRSALMLGRALGVLAASAILLLICWLSWTIPAGSSGLELTWLEMLLPFGSLFAVLLFFGSLALMFSMILPSGRVSGLLSGGLLVANFLLIGMANINTELAPLVEYTPLDYYQGGYAVDGLNWSWLAGLTAFSTLFTWIAWVLFRRRDIRVGGERSWRLPRLSAFMKSA